MVKGKIKEYLVSNYIIQNSDLLFQKSISDIQVKEKGKLVELTLFYKPKSKFEIWNLRKQFYKEPQYVTSTIKNGSLCAKFYAPSKYADLVICKLHTYNISPTENKIFDFCETKSLGYSKRAA